MYRLVSESFREASLPVSVYILTLVSPYYAAIFLYEDAEDM